MRCWRILVIGAILAGMSQGAHAQLESGPRAGEAVRPLRLAIAAGERAGQDVDFVAERKNLPTVYLFVQAEHWSRPLARFLRTFDEALTAGIEGVDNPAAVAVWLTDDVTGAKQYLPRAQESLQFRRTTLAVFEGPKSGPPPWSINDQAHLTAVVVREGKVVFSQGYVSLNEAGVPELVKRLKGP